MGTIISCLLFVTQTQVKVMSLVQFKTRLTIVAQCTFHVNPAFALLSSMPGTDPPLAICRAGASRNPAIH